VTPAGSSRASNHVNLTTVAGVKWGVQAPTTEPPDVPVASETVAAPSRAPETFSAAFDRLFRDAYRVAYRLLGNRDDAAEVAQEALARALVRWNRVSDAGDPAPWVVRVAANLALDRWRRAKTADRHRADATRAEVEVVVVPERIDLHRALAALPRRQRQVVVLRYVADMSEADVAGALGCSVGTVKTHASRGLAALRAALGSSIEEDA
jgi:RNA polymerase sigma-70 factor (sigma-E family)